MMKGYKPKKKNNDKYLGIEKIYFNTLYKY